MTALALQLVKKVVQSGDTACLQPTLDVFSHEDRQLLRDHCHAQALAILRARPSGARGGAHTREAIAYLSLAIFAAGRSCPPAPGVPILCRVHRGKTRRGVGDLGDPSMHASPPGPSCPAEHAKAWETGQSSWDLSWDPPHTHTHPGPCG